MYEPYENIGQFSLKWNLVGKLEFLRVDWWTFLSTKLRKLKNSLIYVHTYVQTNT